MPNIPKYLEYTKTSFIKTVCDPDPIGAIAPSPCWTEGFLDWGERKDLERPRRLEPSEGWSWLKGDLAEGVLVDGCLESLQHLRGTRFWPNWDDVILFFETSENAPSTETVDGMLMDYDNMGVLARVRGLLVGRPMRYSAKERQQLREVLIERTSAYRFPVVSDMDFGHTAPQFVLPLGCRARIDVKHQVFEIPDGAVAETGAT